MNIGNVMDLGAKPVPKADKPPSPSRDTGTFKEDMLRFSEQLEQTADSTTPGHMAKSDEATEQPDTGAEDNIRFGTETDEPENPADAALSAFIPWNLSNILANNAQNSESPPENTQTDTELTAPLAGSTPAQTAQEAQNPVFPLQEAAENPQMPQEELAIPAANNSSEAETFADQVVGEIRQSVVSNEAERTVPVQNQETETQEAKNVTLQDPMAIEAPEEPSAQENDHYIIPEAIASNSEADIQETPEKNPDTDTHADDRAQTPASSADTKKPTGTFAAGIHRNEAPVIEVDAQEGVIAPQELNEGFFDALTEHLETAATNGQDELYIQLKPEVLGGLSVRLLMTDEGLHAQVRTSNQHLQALMNAELSQLADTLRDKGIQVAHMECIYEFMTGNEQFAGRQQHFQGGREDSQKPRRTYAVDGISPQPLISYETMVPTETMEQEGVEFSA